MSSRESLKAVRRTGGIKRHKKCWMHSIINKCKWLTRAQCYCYTWLVGWWHCCWYKLTSCVISVDSMSWFTVHTVSTPPQLAFCLTRFALLTRSGCKAIFCVDANRCSCHRKHRDHEIPIVIAFLARIIFFFAVSMTPCISSSSSLSLSSIVVSGVQSIMASISF